MLAFIKEKITLWEYLKNAAKPVVLYGTGDGADKVIAHLAVRNIEIAGVFASDEFVRGQQFYGHKVRKYSELLLLDKPVIVLICFASELPEQLERFYRLAQIHETYAPHVPVFAGDELTDFAWLAKHERDLQKVYDNLADDFSRQVFAAILNYRISGKITYLKECTTNRSTDLEELFVFGNEEVYVDAGAFTGDTVEEFLHLTDRKYKRIFAVEPDPKNFKKLNAYVRDNKLASVVTVQAGAWSGCGSLELTGSGGRQSTLFANEKRERLDKKLQDGAAAGLTICDNTAIKNRKVKRQQVPVVTVDRVLENEHAGYMKFDVEGVEREALTGAGKHLVPDQKGALPKLLIAAYHHDGDIFTLPQLLWQIQPAYKVYLRKHPYIPAWEINIFAK